MRSSRHANSKRHTANYRTFANESERLSVPRWRAPPRLWLHERRTGPRHECHQDSEPSSKTAAHAIELVGRLRRPDPRPQDAPRCRRSRPEATQGPAELPHWQAAIGALILVAEGRGPLLHARVGMHPGDEPGRRTGAHALGEPEIEAGLIEL
jgi:hypothetical protein